MKARARLASLAILSAGVLLLSACGPVFVKAPSASQESSLHVAVAKQVSGANRLMFDDGITKLSTNYAGWDENVVARLNDKLAAAGISDTHSKNIYISINAIDCAGHYVANCRISVTVTAGTHEAVVVSDKSHGYPLASAQRKAIASVVGKIAGDPAVIKYLVSQP